MRTSKGILRVVVLALGLSAFAGSGIARAGIGFGHLTIEGDLSSIRLNPVVQVTTGETVELRGAPNRPLTNPNRTVGDVDFDAPACGGIDPECARILMPNLSVFNDSVSDGHTHYHAGDRFLMVNEVFGFSPGDTIMIGSPSCDFMKLGLQCRKWVTGYGYVNEQPSGETAVVKSGQPFGQGEGIIELTEPLRRDHTESEPIAKLATAYPGQQLRIDIPAKAIYTDEDLNVRADFIPPQGSRDPTYPRRPLTISRESLETEQAVGGKGGVISFYVPREVMYTQTIGHTFDITSSDTWYSVVVSGRTAAGRLAAYGVFRFKVNPVTIASLDVDYPTAFPMQAVTITGSVRDALALDRPADDIQVGVVVTKPSGSKSYRLHSCYDHDPSDNDSCGGGEDDVFASQPIHHGDFQARIGGPQGLYVDPSKPMDATCNRGCDPLGSMSDTRSTGTYIVTATTYRITPGSTRETSFDVVLV